MQCHGERLGKGGFVDRDTVSDLVALPFLGNEALAESSLNMRHRHRASVKAHVEAVVLQPLQTVLTGVARPAWGNSYPFAHRELGHARTNGLDRACDLVPQNHRLSNPHRAEAAMVEV